MTSNRRSISLGFEHEPICEGSHICLLYRTERERRHVISKFLGSGLESKERTLSLVDTTTPEEFIEVMLEYDLDLRDSEFEADILQANPVYKPDGHFEPERMIDTIVSTFKKAKEDGFVGWRGTGEMTWSLGVNPTPMKRLIEYEALINRMTQECPATVFCQYDANKFDGATILDVLTVHPMMVVRGQLIRNPMYVDPDTFFASLH